MLAWGREKIGSGTHPRCTLGKKRGAIVGITIDQGKHKRESKRERKEASLLSPWGTKQSVERGSKGKVAIEKKKEEHPREVIAQVKSKEFFCRDRNRGAEEQRQKKRVGRERGGGRALLNKSAQYTTRKRERREPREKNYQGIEERAELGQGKKEMILPDVVK